MHCILCVQGQKQRYYQLPYKGAYGFLNLYVEVLLSPLMFGRKNKIMFQYLDSNKMNIFCFLLILKQLCPVNWRKDDMTSAVSHVIR